MKRGIFRLWVVISLLWCVISGVVIYGIAEGKANRLPEDYNNGDLTCAIISDNSQECYEKERSEFITRTGWEPDPIGPIFAKIFLPVALIPTLTLGLLFSAVLWIIKGFL